MYDAWTSGTISLPPALIFSKHFLPTSILSPISMGGEASGLGFLAQGQPLASPEGKF
jgi:hypothetical protein